mmetsp:Transcript_4689/g.7144  ORF Transcript_4689/g.7144 Transcript_4689/m.7144 type:complete len:439 (-) Transcript_4689:193-1509(-)
MYTILNLARINKQPEDENDMVWKIVGDSNDVSEQRAVGKRVSLVNINKIDPTSWECDVGHDRVNKANRGHLKRAGRLEDNPNLALDLCSQDSDAGKARKESDGKPIANQNTTRKSLSPQPKPRPLSLCDVKKGVRIQVWWDGNREWFPGVIKTNPDSSGTFLVQYDDNEEHPESLYNERGDLCIRLETPENSSVPPNSSDSDGSDNQLISTLRTRSPPQPKLTSECTHLSDDETKRPRKRAKVSSRMPSKTTSPSLRPLPGKGAASASARPEDKKKQTIVSSSSLAAEILRKAKMEKKSRKIPRKIPRKANFKPRTTLSYNTPSPLYIDRLATSKLALDRVRSRSNANSTRPRKPRAPGERHVSASTSNAPKRRREDVSRSSSHTSHSSTNSSASFKSVRRKPTHIISYALPSPAHLREALVPSSREQLQENDPRRPK